MIFGTWDGRGGVHDSLWTSTIYCLQLEIATTRIRHHCRICRNSKTVMDEKTKNEKISLSSPVQQAQCPLHRHHIQISAQFRIALTSKNTRFASVLKQKMDKLYMVNFKIYKYILEDRYCFYASQLNLPYQNSQQACIWDLMVEVSIFQLQCWITSWLGSWYIVHHIWACIFSRRCPTKM